MGRIAIAAYLILSVLSVVWGLSGRTSIPDIDAELSFDTEPGYSFFILANRSGENWTDATMVLDGRYFFRLGGLENDDAMSIGLEQFEDGYDVPRPEALFIYERRFPTTQSGVLSATVSSGEVRLITELGETILELNEN